MANVKSLAVHLPAFAVLFYGLSWDVINVSIGWEGYGGKFKYLTFWDQVMYSCQLLTVVVAVFTL